ncbi:MAG: inorganic phosphate transporter [Chloroflexi bacterium]|nr:inorganic phosphate transporter [Chloroflexota bacterium]
MPSGVSLLLILVFLFAIAFDYINGFHDTANAIATSVSTRALRPDHAILMSATANFLGALTGTAVAKTISSGIADTPGGSAGQIIVVAALVGAIAWNIITWRLGIPSSSSHALIGGLLGAVLAAAGTGAYKWEGIWGKVIFPLVTSPVLGLLLGFLLMVLLMNLFQRAQPRRLHERFRLAASAISLGTAGGGWRIIKTMGQRVVKLDPIHGFAAETTAAAVILTASHFGMPVSTTHVISSAIMGVGASDRLSAVRWGVAGNIIVAWVLTIPASGLVALVAWQVLSRVL